MNESGKTTILQAIFAFDYFNDDQNDGGRHLKDVSNLYQPAAPSASVIAEVATSSSELRKIFEACAKENPTHKSKLEALARRKKLPDHLLLERNISTRKYSLPHGNFGDASIQDALGRTMVRFLPYILYFDDFRDKIPEKIEIPAKPDDGESEWVEILEQLFGQTDKTFSLYKLAKLETRQRKAVLSKVQRHLNDTLTKEWQSFRLDDRDALKIHIEFEQKEVNLPTNEAPPPAPSTPAKPAQQVTSSFKNFIKLEVVETDQSGDEHFFFISDRSKGFYWFFNFVMKLEFNAKINDDCETSVYLLDEPGSYLHAYAQRKLCLKLRDISKKNDVIYCTHSHYLLDPNIIPINSVMVADKNENGSVTLTRLINYRGDGPEHRSALQPLFDALQIKPYALDVIHTQTTIITEGIYDYFSLELFRGARAICILPSLGADSIKFYIPFMIAWQLKFRALWDNDPEGRRKHSQAVDHFGPQIASESLRTLPMQGIMQNLFEGGDLARLRRELGLAQDCSFERTILSLFYSERRDHLIRAISQTTRERFEELFEHLNV